MSANTNIKHTVKQLEKEKELLQRILSQHREDPRCHLRVTKDHLQTSDKGQLQCCPTYSVPNSLENNTIPRTAESSRSNHIDQQHIDKSAVVLPDYNNMAYSNNSTKYLYSNVTRSTSSTVSSPPGVSASGTSNPDVSPAREPAWRPPNRGLIPTVIDLIEDD